jgi:hypothetical protein
VGGRDDMRLDEPLDLRFISSQPLYRGVEFDVGVGDGERPKYVDGVIVRSLSGR